ncbi:hypothetical protein [Maritalea porphyrae]|jgi:hypothetical protein|uniref:hypothetical protein n=1 Tax=Maritalea porphyrae TaxID=880732 RepID=UPI0022AFD76E|nr:hypothetical protein [Maritalea porphyrae]MCZ4272441.1 hypothetical protein [Maritalea porphyrae]
MGIKTIIKVEDVAHARVLIPALKGHGFHPIEGTDIGVSGMGGMAGPNGISIQVPEDEAEDAQLLAEALMADIVAK